MTLATRPDSTPASSRSGGSRGKLSLSWLLPSVFITIVLTWVVLGTTQGLRVAADRVWLISAVKSPGWAAINDIQEDMNAGRYELAKVKIDAFAVIWKEFTSGPDACKGNGIGNTMVIFRKIERNQTQSTTRTDNRASQ